MPLRYDQIYSGESFWLKKKVGKRKFHEQTICCDCNLVHDEYYEIKDGKIRVTVFRNDYETKRLRERSRMVKKRKASKKRSGRRKKTYA